MLLEVTGSIFPSLDINSDPQPWEWSPNPGIWEGKGCENNTGLRVLPSHSGLVLTRINATVKIGV